ncbi:lipase [Lithospermum erythrorhizon]|uniref:Lipase n=1 Tax=Lithospermum erythrorhizon TaxID=34254 RepID=A0AAV3Q8X9_LITER
MASKSRISPLFIIFIAISPFAFLGHGEFDDYSGVIPSEPVDIMSPAPTPEPVRSRDQRRISPLVPAMFIFGDSLFDNGNNNKLHSLARADYYPYGIDFEGGKSTGRFSNGYTMVDEIASQLGLPLVPAHTEAAGDKIRHGVNFASAAAGILDNTGRNFLGRIPFNQQLNHFEGSLRQFAQILGEDDTPQILSKSIFFVGMGSNDYLNNYLMPNYNTRHLYNAKQFADLLIKQYTQQLTRLYNLGARKFIVVGLGELGCIPTMLARNETGGCLTDVNNLVLPFSMKSRKMIFNLSASLPNSKFTYIDTLALNKALNQNPQASGFTVTKEACCGIGRNKGQITCLPFQTPCSNRSQYVFWDAFHPTEAANKLFAGRAFNGDKDVAYPLNIKQLVKL